MTGHCITTILEWSGPLGLKGAYKVKLARAHAPAQEFWISEKQFIRLTQDFQLTPKSYSTAAVSVYGIFDGDRFIWSGVQSAKRDDLPYLRERFGVEIRPFSYQMQDLVEFDTSVKPEALEELKDV